MQFGIVVRADVAAREYVFQMLEERRVNRHHVFKLAVDRAFLHHQDLSAIRVVVSSLAKHVIGAPYSFDVKLRGSDGLMR